MVTSGRARRPGVRHMPEGVVSASRAGARRLLAVAVTAAVLGCGLLVAVAPAQAAGTDIGFKDFSFNGAANPPTSDKPQSKLWYAGGRWWADMFDGTSKTWRIFGLDRTNETW